jgi:outer membrane protein assembly factor BamE (lipoprotein component of BamABCDE complex)
MNTRWWKVLGICGSVFCALVPARGVPAYEDVNLSNVAKIQVGVTTAQQIKELLGSPYSKTNYGDCNPVDYREFWEYVGHDANGIFKIHIDFDEAHIARLIAKDSKKGPIVVLASAPKPQSQHRH